MAESDARHLDIQLSIIRCAEDIFITQTDDIIPMIFF